MCGIVGAVSTRNIVPILIEGLKRLEYRGYDSCGVAVHQGGELRRHHARSRMAKRWAMVIDQNRCVGCWTCAVGCKEINNEPLGFWWNRILTASPGETTGETSEAIAEPARKDLRRMRGLDEGWKEAGQALTASLSRIAAAASQCSARRLPAG